MRHRTLRNPQKGSGATVSGVGFPSAGRGAPASGLPPHACNQSHVPDMTGLFYILFFWLAGNALSLLTGGYVSGNIIGMILLFASLCLRWVPAERVRPAARFLLGAMALFFVPYGVG